MPFGSYQVSDEEALAERDPLRQGGAAPTPSSSRAPARSLSRVRAIVDAGIPVMGHIGLTPQSATMLGGFKAQGKHRRRRRVQLVEDALALEDGRLLRARARGGPGAGRGARSPSALDDPDDRHRRRRATATARCSSSTTCSASTEGHRPRFVKRYAEPRGRDPGRARAVRAPRCASGAFPEERAHLRDHRGRARAVRVGARRARSRARS